MGQGPRLRSSYTTRSVPVPSPLALDHNDADASSG